MRLERNDTCEVLELDASRAGTPRLLIEVPHGATRTADYRRIESRLTGPLPEQLIRFFYVNTDIGAPEAAEYVARQLNERGVGVVVLRCLVPRTFIDPNRVVAGMPGVMIDGLTPAVPGYIEAEADRALLDGLHRRYHEVASQAYAQVCGAGGLALQLHSYAPKSVDIAKVDRDIVKALEAAYEPEVYARWPERPAVDLICATADGSFKAAPALVEAARAAWARRGVQAALNGTYALHPATMGYQYAARYPEQVLCVELNRARIADPFVPFGESPISAPKVAQLCAPLVEALLGPLERV